ADLASANDAIRIARPAPTQIHTAVKALPNGGIVRLVEVSGPSAAIGNRRRCHRRRCREHSWVGNAPAERSHVRVLALGPCPAPDHAIEVLAGTCDSRETEIDPPPTWSASTKTAPCIFSRKTFNAL